MNMKSLTIAFAVSVLALTACNLDGGGGGEDRPTPVSEDAPDWEKNFPNNVPGYSMDEYLLGIGSAPRGAGDLMEATEAAKAYIARQIETDLSAVTESITSEVITNESESYSAELKQDILSVTQQMLAGAKTVEQDRREDGRITVLVALNIDNHVDATLARVRTGLQTLGSELGPDGEAPGAKLKRLAKEYVILAEQLPRVASLRAIVPRSRPTYADVEEVSSIVMPRYGRVLKALETMPISVAFFSGQEQKGYADEGLSEQVRFVASVEGKPLEAVPVGFTLEYPNRAEITLADRATDAQGTFGCNVINLQLTGDQENEVWGWIDFEQLGIGDLPQPVGKTFYTLATIETARFAVVVIEDNTGTMVSESVVGGMLEELVQNWKARLIPIDQLLPDEDVATVATAESIWLKQKLEDDLDYILVGDVRAVNKGQQTTGTLSGSFISHAGGTVRLIDLHSGDALVSVVEQPNQKVSSFSRDATMAGESALKKFAKIVGEKVEAEMAAIFNLPAK